MRGRGGAHLPPDRGDALPRGPQGQAPGQREQIRGEVPPALRAAWRVRQAGEPVPLVPPQPALGRAQGHLALPRQVRERDARLQVRPEQPEAGQGPRLRRLIQPGQRLRRGHPQNPSTEAAATASGGLV